MSRPGITIQLPGGVRLGPIGRGVIGRDPAMVGFDAIRLEDPTASLSRNHATVRHIDGNVIEIVDLGSMNGTSIAIAGAQFELVAHEATLVTTPVSLRCGELTVEVTSATY